MYGQHFEQRLQQLTQGSRRSNCHDKMADCLLTVHAFFIGGICWDTCILSRKQENRELWQWNKKAFQKPAWGEYWSYIQYNYSIEKVDSKKDWSGSIIDFASTFYGDHYFVLDCIVQDLKYPALDEKAKLYFKKQ